MTPQPLYLEAPLLTLFGASNEAPSVLQWRDFYFLSAPEEKRCSVGGSNLLNLATCRDLTGRKLCHWIDDGEFLQSIKRASKSFQISQMWHLLVSLSCSLWLGSVMVEIPTSFRHLSPQQPRSRWNWLNFSLLYRSPHDYWGNPGLIRHICGKRTRCVKIQSIKLPISAVLDLKWTPGRTSSVDVTSLWFPKFQCENALVQHR